jgi:hypothetical protein
LHLSGRDLAPEARDLGLEPRERDDYRGSSQ